MLETFHGLFFTAESDKQVMPLGSLKRTKLLLNGRPGEKKSVTRARFSLFSRRLRVRAFTHARGPSIARNEMYKWATLLLVSGFSSELMILLSFIFSPASSIRTLGKFSRARPPARPAGRDWTGAHFLSPS